MNVIVIHSMIYVLVDGSKSFIIMFSDRLLNKLSYLKSLQCKIEPLKFVNEFLFFQANITAFGIGLRLFLSHNPHNI